jgi:hypothetical protein
MIKIMTQLIRKIKQISILLLVISLTGCENDDDNNLPQIVAGFTYTVNSDTGAVTFINISENSRSYEWDFGDGNTSTEINPINTYETGEYTIALTANNAAGASEIFEDIITILIPEVITLPIGFDNANVAYNAITFGGASFEVVDNPDLKGTNTVASKVGAITNSGATFEGFSFDLGVDIDFATKKEITMNFWADKAIDVLVKFEEGSGPDAEMTGSHGGTGWEELTVTFASSDKYSRFTLFVDGPGTTAGTFYIDDITQIETPGEPCTAETTQSLDAADFNLTFQTDPGASVGSFDAQLTTISNPDFENEVNKSCQVGQIDRNGGALFANNQIDFDAKLDFNANAGFKLKVWSPVAGTNVLIKLEDKTDDGIKVEVGAVTTTASAWEELTFDFASGESGKYDKIILFFELNTNTTETYYIDDFMLYADGGGGATCTVETTESIAAADLNITFQTNTPSIIEDNATFAWIDNPDFDGSANTSCKVGQVTRANNSPYDNIQIDLADKIDFNTSEGIKIKVWSPVSNTPVLLKLEEIGNSGNFVQILQTTSVTNDWEELTYDFSPTATPQFNKLVIFFNFDVADGSTYYFDDLKVYGGGGAGATAPTTAPTAPPARAAADVISIYGEAYGAEVGLANVDWDEGSNFAEETIASNNLLKVDFNDFLGTQLNSVVDATEMTNFHMDLWIVDDFAAGQILNPKWSNHTGGAGETNAFEYTNPIGATDAKQWISIDIPITDFTGDDTRADLTQFLLAVASTIDVAYVDNIYFYKSGGGGGGGTGTAGNLATNGDFETGDISGWTTFVDAQGASFVATNTEAACGTFSGNLVSDFEAGAGAAVDAVVKQANIGIGTVTPNTQVTISFDLRGSNTDGGVFFAEFFSELSGGGTSKAEILGGGPLNLTDTWTHYEFTTTTGVDISGGITLQLKTSCGPVADCVVDAYFDNVFVGLGTTGGEDCSGTGGSGGGTGGGGTGTGGTGSGGTGTGSEQAVNGDFEIGDISGWTTFVDTQGASFTASDTQPSTGLFSGNLIADFE